MIDARDRIVMPGFVDTHRHTWQTAFRGIGADWTFPEWAQAMHRTLKPEYRPEDVYAGTLLGRLEALHSGVTTMLDWFHCAQSPEHADAAVAALRDAPGRSVFCHGAGWGTADPVEAEIRRVRSALSSDDGLLTMSFGLRGAEDTSFGTVAAELKLAAELGLRSSLHVESEGIRRPVADLHEHGLLRDTTTFVHANGLGDDELRMLADAGASVSISPDVELKMGFGWPLRTPRLDPTPCPRQGPGCRSRPCRWCGRRRRSARRFSISSSSSPRSGPSRCAIRRWSRLRDSGPGLLTRAPWRR
ncbi:amidohydrolase family protein [Streptomyces sp. NPDC047061]|uniref:amidohydrolase family protein n=1 Tax=Streptomyces sp. NPDC047061 TaxID=3154605 RepID=UPI00340EC805